MENKYTHISIGNINIDIAVYIENFPSPGEGVLATDLDIRPGGAASNYAVAVAQYGHRVYLIASASSNEFAKIAISELRNKGVLVNRVKIVDSPPGIVVILIQRGGERTMVKYPGANVELNANDVPLELIRESHIVHMASINPKLVFEISKKVKGSGALVTYDPGSYINLVDAELIENIDILFLNEKEFQELKKMMKADALFKRGLSILVVKRGEKGAVAILPNKTCIHGKTQPIKKPVDATGAGDAFDAFFNAKFVESKDPSLALKYGVAAGALKVGYKGSFLPFDARLFSLQLEKVLVEKGGECRIIDA
ncbi:MAG: PfkB family carbohydrate kinase [Desulfurococcaceae archaeon]